MNCVLPPLARTLSLLESPAVITPGERSDPEAALQALSLNRREEQILRSVLDGRRYREIAGDLPVHIQTVKKHMHEILAKAQARNRHELAAQLFGLQWVKDRVGVPKAIPLAKDNHAAKTIAPVARGNTSCETT
jgi:DNA-binding NarL/FixJ family response regulator